MAGSVLSFIIATYPSCLFYQKCGKRATAFKQVGALPPAGGRAIQTVRAKVTYVIEWRNKTRTSGQRKEEPMRTKRAFPHVIKQIYHPELEYCLECQSRLERCCTISQRTVITLSQVVQVVHCGYRCPDLTCPGRSRLYRSMQADALALPGFTFGLDIVLMIEI